MGTDLRDREHFYRFVNDDKDDLFISKPVIGRTTGKWSVQLARRINNADGSFGGVVVASLDPNYLSRFYGSVDVGNDGYIRIVGAVGIIRAVGGHSTQALGKDLTHAALFTHFSVQPAGWYYTESNFTDNISRLVTYRSVKDYPLIVTIGLSTTELFPWSTPSALVRLIAIAHAADLGKRIQRQGACCAKVAQVLKLEICASMHYWPTCPGVSIFDDRAASPSRTIATSKCFACRRIGLRRARRCANS